MSETTSQAPISKAASQTKTKPVVPRIPGQPPENCPDPWRHPNFDPYLGMSASQKAAAMHRDFGVGEYGYLTGEW